jgi:transcription factor SFP1
MAQAAAPIDIAPQRQSASPQNQASNLTFALRQEANANGNGNRDMSGTPSQHQNTPNDFTADVRPSVGGRHGSISNGIGSPFFAGTTTRPIMMKDKARRESNTMGSLTAGGMSWGGLSVGSWIRDE